jgi:hypothetical protein
MARTPTKNRIISTFLLAKEKITGSLRRILVIISKTPYWDNVELNGMKRLFLIEISPLPRWKKRS